MYADGAELVLLPFAAIGARVFVPVGTAEQVGEAVAVHVDHGDAFGVVAAEAMREKGHARSAAWPAARLLHAELGGVGGVLRMR